MLVHRFSQPGNRAVATSEWLATMITLCAFGALPDPEIKDVPYVQLVNDGTLFFCFEAQFNISFQEFEDRYEFTPHWHCHSQEALERERAIATLHPHCFEQQKWAVGY